MFLMTVFQIFIIKIQLITIISGSFNDDTNNNYYPEITIAQGRLQGIRMKTDKGNGYDAFLGIPYAKPPFGILRFKEAQPPDPWKGIYNASQHGSDCLQYNHFGYHFTGSEDCLFINVYRPEAAILKANEPLDVIVYIHGGAFMFLSSKMFKPGQLMDENIVFVTFNYRLGPLGFMSTGDNVLPGNLGLKDQAAALRWIHKNIKQFGGNQNSVTITGLSAGGASVHYHYISLLSRGLFHRGISMSGTVLNPWSLAESVPQKTRKLASLLGCPTNDSVELVECLNTRPAENIVRLVPEFLHFLYLPFSPFGPVVEPESTERPFLSRDPYDIIKDGLTAKVPWLASLTTEEGLYPAAEFVERKDILTKLDENWTELVPHLLDYNYTVSCENRTKVAESIRKHYMKDKHVPEAIPELVQLIGDRLFGAGIAQSILMQASKSDPTIAPVYLYRFGYRGEFSVTTGFLHNNENYGVSHADDICYILEVKHKRNSNQKDKEMQRKLINLWITFAKSGVPEFHNGTSLPVAQEGLPNLKYLEIRSPDDATVKVSDNLAQFTFWSSLPLKEKLGFPTTFGKSQEEL